MTMMQCLLLAALPLLALANSNDDTPATDFLSCVTNGNPVMESLPEKCRDGNDEFVNNDPCLKCNKDINDGTWLCAASGCEQIKSCPNDKPFLYALPDECCEACHEEDQCLPQACCKAETAQCLACTECKDVKTFCNEKDNLNEVGCEKYGPDDPSTPCSPCTKSETDGWVCAAIGCPMPGCKDGYVAVYPPPAEGCCPVCVADKSGKGGVDAKCEVDDDCYSDMFCSWYDKGTSDDFVIGDDKRVCCAAIMLGCEACGAGVSKHEFCSRNPTRFDGDDDGGDEDDYDEDSSECKSLLSRRSDGGRCMPRHPRAVVTLRYTTSPVGKDGSLNADVVAAVSDAVTAVMKLEEGVMVRIVSFSLVRADRTGTRLLTEAANFILTVEFELVGSGSLKQSEMEEVVGQQDGSTFMKSLEDELSDSSSSSSFDSVDSVDVGPITEVANDDDRTRPPATSDYSSSSTPSVIVTAAAVLTALVCLAPAQ